MLPFKKIDQTYKHNREDTQQNNIVYMINFDIYKSR